MGRLTLIITVPFLCAAFLLNLYQYRNENNLDTANRSHQLLSEQQQQQQQEASTSQERDFLSIALKTGTDKVAANSGLEHCLKTGKCTRPNCTREECRPWGHFYNTIYQQWLGPYSRDDSPEFQFLEIGFYNGRGFEAYLDFLPNAEAHSMEISCIEQGPREEGKWPWGNFAEKNKKLYQPLLQQERLHCGDANNVTFLNNIWTTKMKRTDAPLKVVVDDGAHLAEHMAQTFFYWFPRIEPGGLLIIEDIQPIQEANKFRTQFLPQIMADLHFCGDPTFPEDACFPTLQPLLAGIHCEMHICVFKRNNKPAVELSLDESTLPAGALDKSTCAALQK